MAQCMFSAGDLYIRNVPFRPKKVSSDIMWLNLYCCQAVRHKLKKGLKMHLCQLIYMSTAVCTNSRNFEATVSVQWGRLAKAYPALNFPPAL